MQIDENTLRNLQLKLIHFGLDPREWEVRQESTHRWIVEHQHQELRLIGETRQGTHHCDWNWLEWVN